MALSSSCRVTRTGHGCDGFVTACVAGVGPGWGWRPAQWGAMQQNRRMLDPGVSEGSRRHSHLHYSFRAQRLALLHKSRSRRVPTLRVGPDLDREWHSAEACGAGGGVADRRPPGRAGAEPTGMYLWRVRKPVTRATCRIRRTVRGQGPLPHTQSLAFAPHAKPVMLQNHRNNRTRARRTACVTTSFAVCF